MIRNLGQVAAIYIGSSAPRNTNLIWLDNTVVPFVFRAYDGSAWSEIATHKWVRAYVDGWLVTLPPRQLVDDGDYMLINSNNVNYKITVKDFVKSAVGNPLDFKGIIRVSADFPNPSTLEAGDMYVIITSPVGGTVTDPYSGKTFEDSEKIVWDEVTRSWESLGKINITVNLTTSYSETEVTIHSSAGKETTIQGVTDQLAGVMLPGQYSWLQALSNGSIVPGDPSSLTPLTPAHKHNYNDIINRLVSQQETGTSTIDPMSQKATTDALNLKFDKASVLQVSGAATDKVMSQKAVTDALKTLRDDFDNKLTNYLPLVGGNMTGNIVFNNNLFLIWKDTKGSTYQVLSMKSNDEINIGNAAFPLNLYSKADLFHRRNGESAYKIWDAYNLPTPASTTDLANYLPLIGGTLTGQLTIKQSVDIKLRLQSTDADNYCIIQAINSQASQLGVFGYAGDKWAIGHNGTYYEIWDKYNLTNPVTYTADTSNYATLRNKDGQYFTYIKAGTIGFLPHSKVALANGGASVLGTSDWSFDSAYINHVYTNKITFGGTGPYIIGSTSATQFLDANGGAQKVATGGLYVGPSYASDALNLVPANGIYSRGIIYIENGIGFRNSIWTNDLTPNKNYSGYLQVLDAYDASSAGGPTNYGTVLQVNSRNSHWANQLWFPGGAEASKNGLYYRHMAYNETKYGNWIKLATTSDLGNYLPLSGGTISSSKPYPLIINSTHVSQSSINFSREGVDKGTVGFYESLGSFLQNDTGETLAVTPNGAFYGVNIESLRRLVTVTDLDYYLPLTGGTLNGALTINGPNTLYHCTLNSSYTRETVLSVQRKGIYKAAFGYYDGIGAFLYNYPSAKYLFVDDNGDARVGTTNGSTKLALITDIPTVSGYLPLSGGTLTGALTMSSRRHGVVIDVIGGAGNTWDEGVGALSVQVPNDAGQTPLLLARRSGAAIDTTTATERLLSMELLDTGHSFIIGMSGSEALQLDWTSGKAGIGKLFGKTIATTDQIPSIPSISISNSGSGNAVTAISASGHTLTVTKGATYLTSHQTIYDLTFQAGTFSAKTFDPNGAAATVNIPTKTSHLTNDSGFITSSALSGYATQSWANGQFAPLSRFNTSTGYTTIKVTGQEFNFDSATSEIYMNYRTLSGSTAVTKITWKGGSNSTLCEGRWGNLYMNDNLVATQSWVNSQNFVKSTSTKKVTDIQPVDVLPATQASGVLYLVFG